GDDGVVQRDGPDGGNAPAPAGADRAGSADDRAAALVPGYGAVLHGHRPTGVNAAAEDVPVIAAEGAVLDQQRALVEDGAAAARRVAAEGAVPHRQGGCGAKEGAAVVDAAARVAGRVAGEDAVLHRQVFPVEDAAAERKGGASPGNGQAAD